MSIPELDPSQAIEAIAEAQLQQELRGLFIVDTQNYLQKYIQIAQDLQAQSWKTDIQELYRCIHTIKGGAVTVGAQAVLYVATALEDVLSDLRYLDLTLPLTESNLSQALLEAGELLTGTLELNYREEIEPILKRIQVLHEQIREEYLPQWNEKRQLHQEFAEQGLDMVVLELEIALEQLPDRGRVPETTLHTAQQCLGELQQIGSEMQFAAGWTDLLKRAEELFVYPENGIWRSQWLRLFQALKACAKQSGNPVPFEFTSFEPIAESASVNDTLLIEAFPDSLGQTNSLTDIGAFLDVLNPIDNFHISEEVGAFLDEINFNKTSQISEEVGAFLDEINFNKTPKISEEIGDFLDALNLVENSPPPKAVDLPETSKPLVEEPAKLTPQARQEQPIKELEKVQIPVPLEKLDQSAQYLVETLLSLKATQGVYQALQNQIAQIVTLAQESSQYITHLRQIQDEYTLLDELRNSKQLTAKGSTFERYRQGYTIINQLLESNLRLSEIGAETEKASQQFAESLQNLGNNFLKLQNTVEDSRLVSFQNLVFRARAILRDLTIRYGKPARLVVQGEQTELDVKTARELEPAILHLIRNAYDHGLEPPAERVAQGKPEQGTITLTLRRQGNSFQLQLGDDGGGINAKAIQARAEGLGLPLTSTQTPAEVLAVICQSGFSSQVQVNEISGRGIGMDVVAAQVARLGGRLSLHTVRGAGTRFDLNFPVPRLLVPCVLLQTGDYTFAIPADDIKILNLLSNVTLSPVKDEKCAYSWRIQDETRSLPALDLLKYWQPHCADRLLTETTVCVYVDVEEVQQSFWLLADELLEQAELVIYPVPSPLIAPEGLIGVSLQPNGALVPVLEVQTLVKLLLTSSTEETGTTTIEASTSDVGESDRLTHPILVVDDAALMRRRLESSLNTYGYLTHCCADGQEAWNWLQTHPNPSLVITDIEMPNMDGFTLIARCRQAGMKVPIIVISSRLSEEWSEEARRLGANDYLTKGFSTPDLINKVSTFTKQF